MREVFCHGVASVFCEEGNRRKGYAGRMMGELGGRLRVWQVGDEEVGFTVLYSDIGKVSGLIRLSFHTKGFF